MSVPWLVQVAILVCCSGEGIPVKDFLLYPVFLSGLSGVSARRRAVCINILIYIYIYIHIYIYIYIHRYNHIHMGGF